MIIKSYFIFRNDCGQKPFVPLKFTKHQPSSFLNTWTTEPFNNDISVSVSAWKSAINSPITSEGQGGNGRDCEFCSVELAGEGGNGRRVLWFRDGVDDDLIAVFTWLLDALVTGGKGLGLTVTSLWPVQKYKYSWELSLVISTNFKLSPKLSVILKKWYKNRNVTKRRKEFRNQTINVIIGVVCRENTNGVAKFPLPPTRRILLQYRDDVAHIECQFIFRLFIFAPQCSSHLHFWCGIISLMIDLVITQDCRVCIGINIIVINMIRIGSVIIIRVWWITEKIFQLIVCIFLQCTLWLWLGNYRRIWFLWCA